MNLVLSQMFFLHTLLQNEISVRVKYGSSSHEVCVCDAERFCFVCGLSGRYMCELQFYRAEGRKGSSVEAQLAESVAGQISWQSV